MKINGRWFQIFSIFIAILLILILGKTQPTQVKGIMGNQPILITAPQMSNNALSAMLMVEKIHVSLGQMLVKDQAIITLKSIDLEREITLTKQNIMLYTIDQQRQALFHELSQLELAWRIDTDLLQIKNQKKEIDIDLSSEMAKLSHLGNSLDRLKNAVQSGLMAQDQLIQVGAEVSVLEKRIPLLKIKQAQLKVKQPADIQKIAQNLAQKELDYLAGLIQKEQEHLKILIQQKENLTIKSFEKTQIQQIFVHESQLIPQDTQMIEIIPMPQTARLWVNHRISMKDLLMFQADRQIRIFNQLGESTTAKISQNPKILQPMPYPLSIEAQKPELGYLLLVDLSQNNHPFLLGQTLTAILEGGKNEGD
jgi:hypothetical protein